MFGNYLVQENENAEQGNDEDQEIDDIIEKELKVYKKHPGLSLFVNRVGPGDGYTDPLEWWMLHHTKFPHVWNLASCILCIPATSAPCERVFSAASLLLNKKQASMKAGNINLLIFLKENTALLDWEANTH